MLVVKGGEKHLYESNNVSSPSKMIRWHLNGLGQVKLRHIMP
jgi:hypothetical protein